MNDPTYPRKVPVVPPLTPEMREIILDYAIRSGSRGAYALMVRVNLDRPAALADAYFEGTGFTYSHTRYSDVGDCLARMYEYTGGAVGKAQDR